MNTIWIGLGLVVLGMIAFAIRQKLFTPGKVFQRNLEPLQTEDFYSPGDEENEIAPNLIGKCLLVASIISIFTGVILILVGLKLI